MNEISVINDERSVTEVSSQVVKIQELMTKVMQKDVHFGIVPGCGKKPSLLKPGAEKLCFVFRLAPEFQITKSELPNGHREYELVCRLRSMSSGEIVGEGVGSCSTMESKYRYRNAADYEVLDEPIPRDSKERKAEYRKQGFGMKQVDGQWVWVRYTSEGKVENPDIADVYNTVLKMAKKRAHVDATITACAASDIFTQDVEDFPENLREAEREPEEVVARRPAQTPPTKQSDGIDYVARAAELNKQHGIDDAMKASIWKECGMTAKAYCEAVEKYATAPAPVNEGNAEGNGFNFEDKPSFDIAGMILELEEWEQVADLPAAAKKDIADALERNESDPVKFTALLEKVKTAAEKR